MYINFWYPVAASEDITNEKPLRVQMLSLYFVAFRDTDGNAHVLTAGSTDDATTGLTLIDAVEGNISRVTADTAYDTIAIYEAAGARGATVVVPPTKTAAVSRRRPRASARDHTILRVKKVGLRARARGRRRGRPPPDCGS